MALLYMSQLRLKCVLLLTVQESVLISRVLLQAPAGTAEQLVWQTS